MNNQYTFEISWMAPGKKNGIYHGIQSEGQRSVEELGYHYITLGPYSSEVHSKVKLALPKKGSTLALTTEAINKRGFRVLTGYWQTNGHASVVLFDVESVAWAYDEYKTELLTTNNISLADDYQSRCTLLFGVMVAQFLSDFQQQLSVLGGQDRIVAHFHGWMSAIGLIFIRQWEAPVATVFTTQATVLGHHLCAPHVDFYNSLEQFDVENEAQQRGIHHMFCIERAAALMADIFTTVSNVGGIEAQSFLKRSPDLITPNGLDIPQRPPIFQEKKRNRKKIDSFVKSRFNGQLEHIATKVRYFFISGKCDFYNNGVDLFIESLSRLNQQMKLAESEITVVVFIIIPSKNSGIDYTHRFKKIYPTPVSTHHGLDEGDPILSALWRFQLLNFHEDRVKVIFHPEFLNSKSAIFPIDYHDFILGCDLGVFPSYYEPWGFAAAECAMLGVASVTTNVSGFGSFMEEQKIPNLNNHGIYIVDRRFKSTEDSIDQLTEAMFRQTQLNDDDRHEQNKKAANLSHFLDWRVMYLNYKKARELATERFYSG